MQTPGLRQKTFAAVVDGVVEVTGDHLSDNRSARRAAAPYRCVPVADCRPYQFLSLASQLPEFLQVDKPMSAGV
jgi:hypothetical protein